MSAPCRVRRGKGYEACDDEAVSLCCTFPEVAFGGRYPLFLPCGARTFLISGLSAQLTRLSVFLARLFYKTFRRLSTAQFFPPVLLKMQAAPCPVALNNVLRKIRRWCNIIGTLINFYLQGWKIYEVKYGSQISIWFKAI